jgi:hypothetical protein
MAQTQRRDFCGGVTQRHEWSLPASGSAPYFSFGLRVPDGGPRRVSEVQIHGLQVIELC